MSKKLKFEFNDYIVAIDDPYFNDCGYVAIGKKQADTMKIFYKSLRDDMVYFYIELQKHIADLEAKLADMTEKYNACQEARKLEIEFNKQDKAELKQQLAEKEETIKGLVFNRFESETNNPVLTTTEIINQDKISFAVEQLSYFKILRGLILNWRMAGFEEDYAGKIPMKYLAIADAHIEKLADVVDDLVDNQIKQLKEME